MSILEEYFEIESTELETLEVTSTLLGFTFVLIPLNGLNMYLNDEIFLSVYKNLKLSDDEEQGYSVFKNDITTFFKSNHYKNNHNLTVEDIIDILQKLI